MTYSAEAAGTTGFLRCHVVQRHAVSDGRTHYTIVVCNETDGDALADAFVPDLAAGRKRTIIQTIVGPRSDFSTGVVLDLEPAGGIPEVHVVLTAGDIHFTLAVPPNPLEDTIADAPFAGSAAPAPRERAPALPALVSYAPAPPLALRTPRAARATPVERDAPTQSSPPVTPIVLGFSAALALAGFFAFRPQIGELGLPATVGPNDPVLVHYRATGLGNAEYAVMGPDGATVASGPLTLGDASFTVRLPRAPGAAAYLVRVRVTNPIGSAVAENYVHVTAPPAPPPARAVRATPVPVPVAPPQIRSLALDRATLASGETLNVYYDVQAASGTIALLDPATQITYGRVPLSETGHATFTAPHTDAERYLSVVLSATRGKATAQSRVALTVTPADAPTPAADAMPPADSPNVAVAEPADISPSATTLSAPATVHSRQTIRVQVHGAAAGLQLRFLDDTGSELARREIRSGDSIADFIAPDVHVPTRSVFEATYPRGAGAETVIRAITILP